MRSLKNKHDAAVLAEVVSRGGLVAADDARSLAALPMARRAGLSAEDLTAIPVELLQELRLVRLGNAARADTR